MSHDTNDKNNGITTTAAAAITTTSTTTYKDVHMLWGIMRTTSIYGSRVTITHTHTHM